MSINPFAIEHMSEGRRAGHFIKAAIYVLMSFGMLIWLIFGAESRAALQKRGVRVEGTVYKAESLPNGRERITYAFPANGGMIVVEDRPVADLLAAVRLGPIPVWYDPVDPQKCVTPNELRLESGGSKIFAAVFMLVLMAFAAFQVYRILTYRKGAMLAD